MTEEELQDIVLDWMLALGPGQQDKVSMDHLDRAINVLFVRRVEGFDLANLDSLRERLAGTGISVGSLKVGKL